MTGSPARAPRVLYLTQWFDPEPVMKGAAFVAGLRGLGLEVSVCTGFPNYPSGRIAPGYRLRAHQRETMGGAPVDRVWLYPSHDGSSSGRAFNYLSFFLSAFVFLLIRSRKVDVIYVYHPPITAGLAAAIAGLFTRTPFVLDVQDLWPDSVAASGMRGTRRLARILTPLCRFVYRRAARVVAQSEGMSAALAARGTEEAKLETIFNWADETEGAGGVEAAFARAFAGGFNVVYAGNLGAAQGLDVLVRAAVRAASDEPAIRLHLIGDGVAASDLAALVAQLRTGTVVLHPPVARERIRPILEAADILAISLKADSPFSVTLPSKLQFYLSVGRPILAVANGEAARIVEEAGAGWSTEPGNVRALARAMVDIARTSPEQRADMGRNGRDVYRRRFSFRAGLEATKRVIEGAARRSAQPAPVPPTT